MTANAMCHDLGMPSQRSHVSKAGRWIIDAPTLYLLEQVFKMERFPSQHMRQRLATDLKVSDRQVQVWFQNRRQRDRNDQRLAEESEGAAALAGDFCTGGLPSLPLPYDPVAAPTSDENSGPDDDGSFKSLSSRTGPAMALPPLCAGQGEAPFNCLQSGEGSGWMSSDSSQTHGMTKRASPPMSPDRSGSDAHSFGPDAADAAEVTDASADAAEAARAAHAPGGGSARHARAGGGKGSSKRGRDLHDWGSSGARASGPTRGGLDLATAMALPQTAEYLQHIERSKLGLRSSPDSMDGGMAGGMAGGMSMDSMANGAGLPIAAVEALSPLTSTAAATAAQAGMPFPRGLPATAGAMGGGSVPESPAGMGLPSSLGGLNPVPHSNDPAYLSLFYAALSSHFAQVARGTAAAAAAAAAEQGSTNVSQQGLSADRNPASQQQHAQAKALATGAPPVSALGLGGGRGAAAPAYAYPAMCGPFGGGGGAPSGAPPSVWHVRKIPDPSQHHPHHYHQQDYHQQGWAAPMGLQTAHLATSMPLGNGNGNGTGTGAPPSGGSAPPPPVVSLADFNRLWPGSALGSLGSLSQPMMH